MKTIWRPIVIASLTLALSACAGLRQFPENAVETKATLSEIDAAYATALSGMYSATSADAKRSVRNQFIEKRIAVIDANYRTFIEALAKENAGVDFGVGVTEVGVGAAGTLVNESASQILSAISAALAGSKSSYDKNVLYEKTISALLAQMEAGRKEIAARIFQNWSQSVDDYPLWVARRELAAYELAGSIPGAIISTASDASEKEKKANAIMMEKVTKAAVTKEMFASRASIIASIKSLSGSAAKALVQNIAGAFPTQAKAFISAQYPSAVSQADTDGSKAKTLLGRLVVLTAKSEQAVQTWQELIAGQQTQASTPASTPGTGTPATQPGTPPGNGAATGAAPATTPAPSTTPSSNTPNTQEPGNGNNQ